jgi:hypothetical protein
MEPAEKLHPFIGEPAKCFSKPVLLPREAQKKYNSPDFTEKVIHLATTAGIVSTLPMRMTSYTLKRLMARMTLSHQ